MKGKDIIQLEEIGFIEKNSKTNLVVNRLSFEGKDKVYLDMRDHDMRDNKCFPTQKGISIEAQYILQIMEFLQMAEDYKAELLPNKPIEIGNIHFSDRKEIRLTLSSFSKAQFLNIREYAMSNESGVFVPTPQGVTVPRDSIMNFYLVLQEFKG